MPYILSVDPGKTTGWAYGHYSDKHAYTLEGFGVTHNGLEGFVDWWIADSARFQASIFVVEGFRLRGSNEFTAALDGVEIIGWFKGHFKLLIEVYGLAESPENMLVFQMPTDKALVPDSLLKSHGFWKTGKDVGHTDGRDVNDAIIHGIAYLFKQKHRPTLDAYFLEER